MNMNLNMETLFNQGSSHGIMDEQLIMVQNISNSSSSSSINDDDDDDDDGEKSSGSSSPSPLQEMSSLLQHLPFKRGLSKHYNGKSQSFTSVSNVSCLEELAKAEKPYNKNKLKTCKSYGGFIPRNNTCSRLIAKKTSNMGRGASSLVGARRNSTFLGNNNNNNNRPPLHPPHRSTSTSSFTSHTPLFA